MGVVPLNVMEWHQFLPADTFLFLLQMKWNKLFPHAF